MKEKRIKAVGILKVILRIVNAIIFIASVIGIARVLMPKKKTDEKVEEESENLDDYIDDIDIDDYNFPEDETLENLGKDATDSEDDDDDFEDNDDDDDEDEDEELKGWDAL